MAKIPKHPGPQTPSQKFRQLRADIRRQADTSKLESATLGAVYDQQGNVVLSTDVQTGVGLGRPLVGFTVANSRPQNWPGTSVAGDANGSSMVTLQESTVWRGWETLHIKAAWSHNSSQPEGQYAGEVALLIEGEEVFRQFLVAETSRLDFESRFDISHLPYGGLITVQLQARGSTSVTSVVVRGALLAVIGAGNGA